MVREPRVYVALADSLELRSGDRVTFRLHERDLGSGLVTRVVEHELAIVELRSGSLAPAKQLTRVEILAERSASRPLARLRVGYPGAGRSNLLFACERVGFVPPLAGRAYRAIATSERGERWSRDPSVALPGPWPDTLTAQFFDDANDEEIALERGDVDVAIFWPGELSRQMREQSRWEGHLFGVRSRGVVAALGLRGTSSNSVAVAPDSAALERFNRELFRDDLLRWSSPGTRARPFGPIRFEVDLASPGWREMQRLLDGLAPATARHARLDVRNEPVAALDSLAASGTMTPLFLLRCPVVCAPELRPVIDALGADALVDALDCRMRRRTP